MKEKSFYPRTAGELTEEERIAVCAALYPKQANKSPESRALWPKERLLTAKEKMAWSRHVRRPPATRYDIYPAVGWKYGKVYRPTDPILWALRMRRAELARRLLEDRGLLGWVDASRYAPWTLRWSPSLLKLILDLAPSGEPLGCCHRFTRTGGDWQICVNATLLTAAAALDDIEAVELLLQYGYDVAPEWDYWGRMLPEDMYYQYFPERHYDRDNPDWRRMHSTLPLDITRISYHHNVFLIPTEEGARKGLIRPYPPVRSGCIYGDLPYQPLAAALACGATRCALRLLEYPRAVASSHTQATVFYLADFDVPFRETLDKVMDALGTSPERFVEPLSWTEKSSERYLKCLQYHDFYSMGRNGERYDCAVHILNGLRHEWAKKAAALLPAGRLSRALPESIRWMGRLNFDFFAGDLAELQAQYGITVTLQRDAVLPGTFWYALLRVLDHVAVDPPAEDHLSALAVLLLNAMLLEPPLQRKPSALPGITEPGEGPELGPMYEITHSEKAMRLLREENRELVRQALDAIKKEHPESCDQADAVARELLRPDPFSSQFKRL